MSAIGGLQNKRGAQMLDIARSDYLPRFVDAQLAHKLSYMGAVAIRGPKWCGKTETALQQAASAVMLQDPDQRENNLMLAATKPSILLRGAYPRLIDEWQDAPQLWDAVRYAVDRSGQSGQFMLTGSATPAQKPLHSGTGRFAFVDMLPMSLAESGESTGEVSLAALFDGQVEPAGSSDLDVESLAQLVCRGGWPRAVLAKGAPEPYAMAREYVTAIAEEDISRADGVRRNAQHARLIMREYARCTATQAAQATIRKDIKESGLELSKDTVDSYIATLRALYVVRDLPAWTPSLHSKARVAKSPTRHFVDPSLACAALGATPELLLKDMSTYGLLFESLCVRDLRAYAGACGGNVFHYRDDSAAEADAVVQLADGRYALFEVKMSAKLVDEGAASLLRIAEKVDASIMGAPAFSAVITPGGYAYQRPDGVLVLPIGCLTA
jgi:hypothetical protein